MVKARKLKSRRVKLERRRVKMGGAIKERTYFGDLYTNIPSL